jgi:ABC-type lipoprotein release transport system permease subunit
MSQMTFIFRLAMKNLFRHGRRTVITAAAIAFGLMMFIIMDSMLAGIGEDSERNLVLYETGSARVVHGEYWDDRENMPLEHSIAAPRQIIAELAEAGYAAVPRTVFRGELIMRRDPFPEDGSMQVSVTAVDPGRDGRVFELRESITSGRWLQEEELGAVIGAWLAEDIGAEVGYPLTIVTRTKDGYYQTIDVEIVGLANTPNPVVNRTGVFLPLGTADFYLQMGGEVTEIDVSFPFGAELKKRTAEIRRTVLGAPSAGSAADGGNRSELMVVDWKEIGEDFVALASAKSAGSNVILLLVFVIAAVGISNTMLMSVYERIRELGMMRAMGMRPGEIRAAFLIEAGGIGLIGAVLGIALGVLLNIPLVNHGIDYSFLMRDYDMGYRITGIMRGMWNPGTIITAFFTGIGLSVIIAFIPTRKALKQEITDALRYQ